ncbi:radical SAM protein [Magnetofaba australis]|uniref:Radical SAM domain-containing protein n=1 Tax=Magnetofaba australis IT-1 TaxID=1434232 RepID=A0A1Y2K2Y6_9PROT|nr:radical SAM protein [Magnetofaba australis]OSM02319.1 hypothetical protein MAIT1_02444 [Magnetofaba australis IT-1]
MNAPQPLTEAYIHAKRSAFKLAVNRATRSAAARAEDEPAFAAHAPLQAYRHAWHWLRENVHPRYFDDVLAASANPSFATLAELLANTESGDAFAAAYLDYGLSLPTEDGLNQTMRALLAQHQNDRQAALHAHAELWRDSGHYVVPVRESVRAEQMRQKALDAELLGPLDQERLALIDALPDPPNPPPVRFDKVGIIPRMSCPQSCPHCLFIHRSPVRASDKQAREVLKQAQRISGQMLFSGGDLTDDLPLFYHAVESLNNVARFAILLNGEFAIETDNARRVLTAMQSALNKRSRKAKPARIALQISFDDFHQEIQANHRGELRERIPVAAIANIIEAWLPTSDIELSLQHKQTSANFDPRTLFSQGALGRLTAQLAARGYSVAVDALSHSPREKQLPQDAAKAARPVSYATFHLQKFPHKLIHLMSSVIDAYGRAATLDPSAYINEKSLLNAWLNGAQPPMDPFDRDPMLWLDGRVTLFSATHICLGNAQTEGWERVWSRWRKDPLAQALAQMDRTLIERFAALWPDKLAQLRRQATSPHYLLYAVTESSESRLKLTKSLIE